MLASYLEEKYTNSISFKNYVVAFTLIRVANQLEINQSTKDSYKFYIL